MIEKSLDDKKKMFFSQRKFKVQLTGTTTGIFCIIFLA